MIEEGKKLENFESSAEIDWEQQLFMKIFSIQVLKYL